jgi:hypothetical protein
MTIRVVSVPANRTAALRELRGNVMFLLAAGVELSLPKMNGDNYVALVKAAGTGCKVSSAAAGLEIGEGATSGDPVALTLTTADVTLMPGEARTYIWAPSVGGWLLTNRPAAPSVLRATSTEWSVEATSDGTAVNYDLPAANIGLTLVFVNGVPLDNSGWSISAGAGTGGVDRLVLASAPTNGHKIKVAAWRRTAL